MNSDMTWFWEIVDRDGLGNVPSCEKAALAKLVRMAMEREEKDAEIARLRKEKAKLIDALKMFVEAHENAWHPMKTKGCEMFNARAALDACKED